MGLGSTRAVEAIVGWVAKRRPNTIMAADFRGVGSSLTLDPTYDCHVGGAQVDVVQLDLHGLELTLRIVLP